MTQREWWPSDYADEVMPPGRESPSAWIRGPRGDTYELAGADDDIEGAERDDDHPRIVRPGEVIDFVWCESLGTVEVTIFPDGAHRVHGVVPAHATHFWLAGDPESLAHDIPSFVRRYRETEDVPEPVRETVRLAQWSAEIPHVLIVTAAEGPQFMELTAAEAPETVQ